MFSWIEFAMGSATVESRKMSWAVSESAQMRARLRRVAVVKEFWFTEPNTSITGGALGAQTHGSGKGVDLNIFVNNYTQWQDYTRITNYPNNEISDKWAVCRPITYRPETHSQIIANFTVHIIKLVKMRTSCAFKKLNISFIFLNFRLDISEFFCCQNLLI